VTASAGATSENAGRPRSFRRVLGLLRPHRREIRATVLNGLADRVFSSAAAVVAATMVGLAVTGTTSFDLWPWFIVLGFIVVPQMRMPWLESISAHAVSYRVQVDLRRRILEAFARLAPGYMLRRRSGGLAAVAMTDADTIERFFSGSAVALLAGIVVPVLGALALALFQPLLGLALVPFLALSAAVPWWLHRRAERQGEAARAGAADLDAEVVDTVQGLREILAFGREVQVTAALEATGRRATALRVAHGRRWGIERALADALVTLGTVSVLLLGVDLAGRGTFSFALLPPSVVLAVVIFGPLVRLHHAARHVGPARAAGDRIFDVLDAPTPVEYVPPDTSIRALEPAVSFDHVSFRYGADLPDALVDVSFSVPAGRTTALVGPSGAGKSTAIQLLLRSFDPTDGAISIGGSDLRRIPTRDLRELVCSVPQDVYLFNESIAENIRLGRPDATDEEVERAARSALAHEFISALPDGYSSVVGERGSRLSGGQRQRLAIARALLRDPAILVMDEPVSNLDVESELELTRAMRHARDGRTTLLIAHRLSTVRSADQIVVLDRGRVVGSGTHEELLAAGGLYTTLVSSQLAGG